jgi:predicted Rossmann-fold nucleotide-binding protein
MEAGIEGAGAEQAFGVNILLPFEDTTARLLTGDPKLINYRYFFTRKLTFMKEAKAFALLPGGFGTLDEAFELLTLMQTGRSAICPVVLLEAEGGTYWQTWRAFVEQELVERGLVDPNDLGLVARCTTVDEAVREVTHFYSRYHSMRFVGRRLVVRMLDDVADETLDALNEDFADIVAEGRIERTTTSTSETDDDDVPDLPRIALRFDRWHYSRLRQLIDALNDAPPRPA